MTHLLLLVEIKRSIPSCWMYNFARVLDQTNQQACNAFASFPEVNTFGLIIALGDCWTYRYHQEELRPSLTWSKHSDPTFEEPSLDLSPLSKALHIFKIVGQTIC
jgi:hypothetical protein